ncbi:Bilirubin oxidase [Photobacterium proteolyticum]|uniref:Bilirubin oxidase n=1 Tax=Photobacterium proteolyticum TaxID=1903952 RepID=A0A1Q9GV93_9GAMM|nr:multicopper oxidase domain-containing protein [Photobacterium proteolyticum]OLQ79087.1 Bilirubin oxidase [Photobacterium proteolyticum]
MTLKNSALLLGALVSISLLGTTYIVNSNKASYSPSTNKLMIPELIDTKQNRATELVIQEGRHEFFSGVPSETKGVNGDYLGPTIKLYQGKSTQVTFTNDLNEATTIHGHGLHVDGRWDGGPQNVIMPGKSITYSYEIIQQAGTSWYHPHLMGKTAEQVHAGVAGFIIIEDDNSDSLDVPSRYGVDDIPIVVQDRSFVNGVMRNYSVSMEQIMEGLKEETLVVNGQISPYYDVPSGWIRLRLLNGSNARYHSYTLENGDSFWKIATDGGFLESPVEMTSLVMAPGERNEILVNMVNTASNRVLVEFLEDEQSLLSFFKNDHQVALELRVDDSIEPHLTVADVLNVIEDIDRNQVSVERNFVLEMGEVEVEGLVSSHNHHSMFSINGRSMDMNTINHSSKKGQYELWRISGQEMRHPFHMHGTSFLIVSQNGAPPNEADRGWKDTVDVNEGITEVVLKFDVTASKEYPFMYHCHILEHEDAGMMGQFTVE